MNGKKKDANTGKQTTAAQNIIDEQGEVVDNKNLLYSLHNKADVVTKGLDRYLRRQLKEQVSVENSEIISDYSLIQKKEMNLSDTYRFTTLSMLIVFCKFLDKNHF
jgi:hypothetical protein